MRPIARGFFLLLLACSDKRDLRWELTFVDEGLVGRAIRIEARVLTGGCSGEGEVFAAKTRGDEPTGSSIRLAPGTYGLFAFATDADCVIFAEGCLPVTVPNDDRTVTVELVAVTERATCPASACEAGVCVDPPDAGIPSNWITEMIDEAADLPISVVLDAEDVVHVLYDVHWAATRYDVWHAWGGPSDWSKREVDLAAVTDSPRALTLSASGNLYAAYVDQVTGYVMMAMYAGETWSTEMVEIGQGPSVAVDNTGQPKLCFVDTSAPETRVVHYAERAPAWTLTAAASAFEANYCLLGLDADDRAHVAFYQPDTDDLLVVSQVGDAWMTHLIGEMDVEGIERGGFAFSVGWDGVLHAAYVDNVRNRLIYTTRAEGAWSEVADWPASTVVALALDSTDEPHLSFADSSGSLRYASPPLTTDVSDLVAEGAVIDQLTMAVDALDRPHIVYVDSSDGDGALLYAH